MDHGGGELKECHILGRAHGQRMRSKCKDGDDSYIDTEVPFGLTHILS